MKIVWAHVLGFAVLFLLLLKPAAVRAEKYELNTGEVIEGTLLDQNEDYYYLDTRSGVISLEKTKVVTRNGKAPAVTYGVTFDTKKSLWLVVEPPPANAIAAVGNSGIPMERLKPYLDENARKLSKPVESLSPEEKSRALEKAIGDELLYQGILKRGFHRFWPMRDNLINRLLDLESERPEVQNSFSEAERQQSAAEFPEKTRKPVQLHAFHFISYDESRDEVERLRKEAAGNPKLFKKWVPFSATGVITPGWISEDTKFIGATDSIRASIKRIFEMKAGEISEIMPWEKRMMFAWVQERTGGEPLPADQVRTALTRELLKAKITKDAASDQEKQDLLFKAALEAQTYRDPKLRSWIFHDYASESRQPEEIDKLRSQFKVTIVKKPDQYY